MLASDHVSFDGDYNTQHTPSEPAGKEIIEQLSSSLVGKGINTVSRYKTDYSQGIIVSVLGTKYYIEAGPVGDENANWLAYFGLRFNFLGLLRFFLRKKHNLLANALNDVLYSLPQISNIRWYKNQYTWNYKNSEYTVKP